MTCAATVEVATTADRASAMEAVAAVEFITATASIAEPFVTMEPVVNVPVVIPTTAMIPVAPIIPIAAAIVRAAVEAMEPRAGADEYSVHEVVRAPISIRRASVRSIRVVAVGANRRCTNRHAHRTNSNSYSHSYLRARHCAHRERQNPNHYRISNMS
jgi:hypothetical protein